MSKVNCLFLVLQFFFTQFGKLKGFEVVNLKASLALFFAETAETFGPVDQNWINSACISSTIRTPAIAQ
jgi:hypothetical protein